MNTVTIVGANGTMGRNVSAIFASFGHAKVYMVCRDIKKAEEAKNKAYQSVRAESVKEHMYPADYSMLEQCIRESHLIFESAVENWTVKNEITERIARAAEANLEHSRNVLFCTGTSGLSITKLSENFSEVLRPNYIGMHFFNPPYNMALCEMTPTKYTDRKLFESAMEYCRSVLFRTVVEVKDSPAFLGNRIGFEFINRALQCAERYKDNGGIDYIDAILGAFTGRSMAPLVTANFVGLDVHKAIVDNIYENTNDFAHEDFVFPRFANELVASEKLGRKAGGGLYKTELHDSGAKIHFVYDIASSAYRQTMKYIFPFKEQMIQYLKEADYEDAFHVLKTNQSLEARICFDFLIRYVLYSLKATELVGYDVHAADDVMAAGFNWCPPLAMIDAFGGVEEFRKLCKERFVPGETDQLLDRVEPSKYDFRRFIRAKY